MAASVPARLRYYVAASLDGFIATPDGGVDWLKPYQKHDYGFTRFMAGIGGVFMGRGTYNKTLSFGPWSFGSTPAVVMTNRPLPDAPAAVEARSGDVGAAYSHLRDRLARGDVWLLGGGRLAAQCLERGLLDELELYTMPVVLGGGLPLFAELRAPFGLTLQDTAGLAGGVVRSVYRSATSPA